MPLVATPVDAQDGEFIWIGVADPSADEMANLQAMFGLHPLAVEDALNAMQVPKVDIYGNQLFVVIKTAPSKARSQPKGKPASSWGSTI